MRVPPYGAADPLLRPHRHSHAMVEGISPYVILKMPLSKCVASEVVLES